MTHLSRNLRLKKLSELLPVCSFVDFRDGEYKLLFPYPNIRKYVEIDHEGRVTNYVAGDGVVSVDPKELMRTTARAEYNLLGKDRVSMINRRITYLHDRYLKGKRAGKHVVANDHPGRSREGYDSQSNANREQNTVLVDHGERIAMVDEQMARIKEFRTA